MRNFLLHFFGIICFFLLSLPAFSQQVDLFKMQDSTNALEPKNLNEPVLNTFYSSRLVNSQTVEILGPGSMDFRIHHRFAQVNTGLYDFFGLDYASMRLGLDFGITKNLMVGIGRATYQKEIDGFIKYRLMHQSTGTKGAPLSIAAVASWSYRTIDMDPSLKVTGSDRSYFTGQLLIARKLNEHTSIQVSPTYTHYNRIIGFTGGGTDLFSIGLLARQKISRKVSINAEYFIQTTQFNGTYDPLSIGVDINTGGHVFQLHFTNATGMNEHTFIHETTGSWGNGDIRIGFNISRIFNIGKRK